MIKTTCSDDNRDFEGGLRLRFSFHSDTALPRKQSNGKLDCSGPQWRVLQHHFLCNFYPECDGGEDEVSCPYVTEACGPGHISIGGSCYIYRIPQHKISWMDAERICRLQGEQLAMLKSKGEWSRVITYLHHGVQRDKPMFIGLQTSSKKLSRM